MIDDYIVFDALCQINSKYQSRYTRFRDLEREAIEERNFEKLLAIFLAKQTIKTIIYFTEFRIESEYKEAKRTRYFIEFPDSTHLMTITYRTEEKNDIFEIMEENKKIKEKFSRGLQRMRMYFRKYLKYKLKYVYSKEITQKGYLHFHLLLKLPSEFRENFKNMIEKLSRWFSTENQGIDLKYLRVRDRKKAIEYILKYISKENEPMFFEIGDSKIYFTSKKKLIRNMERRVFSYSYARKPRIKRYRPQKISRIEHSAQERIVEFTQEREKIPKITQESEKKQLIEKILDAFIKYEWKMYDVREAIQEYRKTSELIEAERDAVDF